MSFSLAINYGNLLNVSMQGKRTISTSVNNMVEIPDGAQTGAITCTVLTAATASTRTDGTMLTNDINNTQVALTFVDEVVTRSISTSTLKNILNNPANMQKQIDQAANALDLSANNALVADWVAATPGTQKSLATGRTNFTAGTDAQNTVMLQQVQTALQAVIDTAGDADMNNYGIVAGTIAHGNFTTLRGSNIQYAQWDPSISMSRYNSRIRASWKVRRLSQVTVSGSGSQRVRTHTACAALVS
jgi:hypothetical protein